MTGWKNYIPFADDLRCPVPTASTLATSEVAR